jgi:hypothetical protein
MRIPPEFRKWLARVNGGPIGPGGMFGVDSTVDAFSIRGCLKTFPEWKGLGWLPVAADGVGNYWVSLVGPNDSEGWVAFIDTHESPELVDSYVASGVASFIRFLLESELGEKRWPRSESYVVSRDPGMSAIPYEFAPWNRARR